MHVFITIHACNVFNQVNTLHAWILIRLFSAFLVQKYENILPLQTHHGCVFILELPLQLGQQTPC